MCRHTSSETVIQIIIFQTDRKLMSNNFDSEFVIEVIYQAKTPNTGCYQLLKYNLKMSLWALEITIFTTLTFYSLIAI